MSGDALAVAMQDMFATEVADKYILTGTTNTAVYIDRVPSSPTFPYVLVVTNFPTVAERSLARSVSARVLKSRTVVVGSSASSVRIIAQKLTDRLEGQRPDVAGWVLGSIESIPNDQPIQPDLDVTIPGTAENPMYQPFDWILTGSPTP